MNFLIKERFLITFLKFGLKAVFTLLLFGIISFFSILYVPLSALESLRDLYVTTAMTTLNHQYLATWFLPSATIDEIMKANTLEPLKENSRPQEIILPVKKETEITVTPIQQGKFKGWLTEVDDPSRVKVGTADLKKNVGMKIEDIVKKYGAVLAINAGGFEDDGGVGNGGQPLGLVIENGNVIHPDKRKTVDIIGFNENDVLVIGNYKAEQISGLHLRDAVSFKPALIVNGKPMITTGNGGWGIAPRTIIGQKKDGSVLFLAIDGRQVTSVGATLREAQDIMLKNGAYNAANLDGGASTALFYQGEMVNHPSSPAGDRYLPDAFYVEP